LQLISTDEIINHKVLPFDIFNEKGKIIFSAGEILTPGKILQLKYIPKLYIEEKKEEFIDSDNDFFEILDEDEDQEDILETLEENDALIQEEIKKNPAETAYFEQIKKKVIKEEVKQKITNQYKEAMDSFIEEGADDPSLCIDVRDSIIEEVLPEVNKILYRSQLKVFGDYYYAHGINVSMLSAILAHKMRLSTSIIKDITLSAMLHDIGKIRVPSSILKKHSLAPNELKLIQLHPKIGYKIIKQDLMLSENIAQVALQHHEKSDGSGYPFGISGNSISLESHIVSICNIYDQLTSGKGDVKVKNNKEAIKYILELGTKYFKSDVLYTFVHMTNYNDFAPIIADYF